MHPAAGDKQQHTDHTTDTLLDQVTQLQIVLSFTLEGIVFAEN